MRFAYADPPYYRCARLYTRHHPEASIWDTREAHLDLVARQTGLPGAKPARFNRWIADLLGVGPRDELVDLFPGTGGMGAEMAQGVLL